MKEVLIQLVGGLWLINGKKYQELTYQEKVFFDEFLIAMRVTVEAEKRASCKC